MSFVSFLHPDRLWWLSALPALFVLWRVSVARVRRGRRRFADFAKVERISRVTTGAHDALRALLLAGVFAALVLAVAQPRVQSTARQPIYRRQDVIFLLDASPSMKARDVHPSRLERAKEEIRHFVADRGGLVDRIGLVTFAGSSVITSYLTSDLDNIPFYLDFMEVVPSVQYGTNFGAALTGALALLEKEAEMAEKDGREDTSQKILFFLSDGEDFGQELEQAIEQTLDTGIPVYAIGIGSNRDAPIPLQVGGVETLLRDESGAVVSARFDESSLRRIAMLTGGRYYRSYSGSELAEVVTEFLESGREVVGQESVQEPVELYPKLLLSGAALLVLTLVI
jgi:Ca-activated chloride channel family protein